VQNLSVCVFVGYYHLSPKGRHFSIRLSTVASNIILASSEHGMSLQRLYVSVDSDSRLHVNIMHDSIKQ